MRHLTLTSAVGALLAALLLRCDTAAADDGGLLTWEEERTILGGHCIRAERYRIDAEFIEIVINSRSRFDPWILGLLQQFVDNLREYSAEESDRCDYWSEHYGDLRSQWPHLFGEHGLWRE